MILGLWFLIFSCIILSLKLTYLTEFFIGLDPLVASYPWFGSYPGFAFVPDSDDPFRLKRPNRRPGKRPGFGIFQRPTYPIKYPNFSDKHPDYDLFLLALKDQNFQSYDFDLLE